MKQVLGICDSGVDAARQRVAGTTEPARRRWQTAATGDSFNTLARFASGRIVLHMLAMVGDRCVRFHTAGIARELSTIKSARRLRARLGARVIDWLVRYVSQPSKLPIATAKADAQVLAMILDRGDVLLSEGSTRLAALGKRITRSLWSHVSMYVGPLEDGPDPLCIVEADIASGVRSIRLSELDAVRVRVLRPRDLNDTERSRLADWVTSQIGSEYDLPYALAVARDLLHLNWRKRSASSSSINADNATRFICCSLLAHAFSVIGYPIVQPPVRVSTAAMAGYGSLTPGDFEHAANFALLHPESA